MDLNTAVVPGYYLVCYNYSMPLDEFMRAVVPGYYLVCYNLIKLCLPMFQL